MVLSQLFTRFISCAAVVSLCGATLAYSSDLILGNMEWRYQEADSGEQKSQSMDIPSQKDLYTVKSGIILSDPVLEKTLFVKELATSMQKHLLNYNQCEEYVIYEPDWPYYKTHKELAAIVDIDRCYFAADKKEDVAMIYPYPDIYKCPIRENSCTEHRTMVAKELEKDLEALNKALYEMPKQLISDKLLDTMDLGSKLVANMRDQAKLDPYYYIDFLEIDFTASAGISGGVASAAKGLTVSAGGAQNFGFIRKTIKDGNVPSGNALTIEGFFNEFELNLQMSPCAELICMQTAAAYDLAKSKLYVQLSMNSNVTAETFSRKAANLSIVIDVSGSMSAADNTEKDRLEWAKDAALKTIEELNADDYLSVVIFNETSEVVLPVSLMDAAGKKHAKEVVRGLQSGGSTNLESGLRDGYLQVAKQWKSGYENRVILVSDAGLNTGVTEESSLLKLVTDNAQDNIGLTAIGLGLNFNQDFIHNITQSRGGNYMFVHSGKAMYKFFENFDFLVTPVAYSFRAAIDGVKGQLAKTYGVPQPADAESSSAHELISVETLFFAGSGGGAILLEYDLQK